MTTHTGQILAHATLLTQFRRRVSHLPLLGVQNWHRFPIVRDYSHDHLHRFVRDATTSIFREAGDLDTLFGVGPDGQKKFLQTLGQQVFREGKRGDIIHCN